MINGAPTTEERKGILRWFFQKAAGQFVEQQVNVK
jgi:hypothetical protein